MVQRRVVPILYRMAAWALMAAPARTAMAAEVVAVAVVEEIVTCPGLVVMVAVHLMEEAVARGAATR